MSEGLSSGKVVSETRESIGKHFNLIPNQEYLERPPAMNVEAVSLMASNPLWLNAENLEQLRTLTKTDATQSKDFSVHPLFSRMPKGYAYELHPALIRGFRDVDRYISFIKGDLRLDKDEEEGVKHFGPYNHGSEYPRTLVHGAVSGSLLYSGAYENPDESLVLFSLATLASVPGGYMSTLMNRQDAHHDAGMDRDFELDYIKYLETIASVISRFSYLIARDADLNISEIDSAIIEYDEFTQERNEVERLADSLDRSYTRNEANQRMPSKEEIIIGKNLFHKSMALLEKIDRYLKNKTESKTEI